MRSIMAQDSSFSFSRRYFHWKKKLAEDEEDDDDEEILNFRSSSLPSIVSDDELNLDDHPLPAPPMARPRRKKPSSFISVSKLRSALTFRSSSASASGSGLGKTSRIVGTLFGYRRGHVHIAFQEDPKLGPAFLVELAATPTSFLVREMASGQVRIALECDKKREKKGCFKLLDEPLWRTYCNGKKCGYAMRRDCGPDEWKVLNSVGPISMGAGVLPAAAAADGELMYMRARFERILGTKDSEAFYMMNPDSTNGTGPELSIYLIRV